MKKIVDVEISNSLMKTRDDSHFATSHQLRIEGLATIFEFRIYRV